MNNLLEFIRKLWNNPTEPELNIPADFGWPDTDVPEGGHNIPPESKRKTESLTQKELQLLRSVVATHIREASHVKEEIKNEALLYEIGDDNRNILFKEHREIRGFLKKLSALQHKLKYKIQTEG